MKHMARILKLFILTVLMFALFGCSSEVKKNEVTEITFSFWEPGVAHEIEEALQNIVDEYEELHQDIKIRLISEPVESYQDWIKSCIIADDLPDIQSNHNSTLISQYNAGLIVNVSDELNSESAYEKGKQWKSTFKDFFVESGDGSAVIPFFAVELGIYYNKAIYDRLGLEVPKTWDEFMYNCAAVERAGILPVAFMAQKSDACLWLKSGIAGGLFAKKHLSDKDININGDKAISSYETYRALLNGKLDFANDTEYQTEYREYASHMKEFLKYCGGYPGFEESVAKAMFLSGEAAHIHTGSWDAYGMMLSNDNFEAGVFAFPVIVGNEDADTQNRIMQLSGQGLAVTNSVYKEEGKLEKVIDFLQYFTSKEVYQRFIADTAHLPVVKDVSCVSGMEVFEYDGYHNDMLLIKDESDELVLSILSGNFPVLNDDFFNNYQKQMSERARVYAEEKELSAANGYNMKESVVGVFEGER